MKAILISDHAKWCALMMNGIKKAEIRKGTALYRATQKLIEENGYAEFYVYCTKGKQGIFKERHNGYTLLNQNKWIQSEMNGKVIFKFRCYKVEELKTCERHSAELIDQSCLSANEFYDYLTKGKNFLGQVLGCAIHISNLEIFDKPKELSEFYLGFRNNYYKREFGLDTHIDKYDVLVQPTKNGYEYTNKLTKAPQNFCYVEVE